MSEQPLQQVKEAPPGLSRIGARIKHARRTAGVRAEELANAIGISRRTMVKIEQGNDTVAAGSFARAAEYLSLTWAVDLFSAPDDDAFKTPLRYLSGTTALSIPRLDGGPPALWYSSALANTSSWRVTGRDYISTRSLLGVTGLWDATEVISRYVGDVGAPDRVWAASHERALFDLLVHFCHGRGQPVPNTQVSDIDDVVDIKLVQGWLDQSQAFLSPSAVDLISEWMEGGY